MEQDQSAGKPWRYKAFFSYSRADDSAANWLHAQLEAFRTPRELVNSAGAHGAVPAKLTPIFRDRTDLSGGGELTAKLIQALDDSRFLIVLCSPASAKSNYVNQEVDHFIALRGRGHIFPVIVSGEPESGDEKTECFPVALRGQGLIAADLRNIRQKGGRLIGDGRRGARTKLIAGLLGVALDQLVQREGQRKLRQMTAISLFSFVGMVMAGGLAYYANDRRIEANAQRAAAVAQRKVAERQTLAARASADFLVDTFELTNTTTQNPREITAIAILNKGAEQARQSLGRQPEVRARLVDTLARAYVKLGFFQEARTELELALPSIRAAGVDGAQALDTLAGVYQLQGESAKAIATAREALHQLGHDDSKAREVWADVYETIGYLENDSGQHEQALRDFDTSIAYYRSATLAAPVDVARALTNKAYALTNLQRYAEARTSLMQANAIFASALGESSLPRGQNFLALASNAYAAGAYAEGEQDVAAALRIYASVLDADNPIIATARRLRGQIAIERGRYAEARTYFTQALKTFEVVDKHYSMEKGMSYTGLAVAESYIGDTDKALRYIDLAIENLDKVLDASDANRGDVRVQKAGILRRSGRLGEARTYCASGLDIIAVTQGRTSEYYKFEAGICSD